MSYIRCLSNPEKLYIWAGDCGTHISAGSEDGVVVNSRDFHNLLRKWFETGGGDPIVIGNLRVEEVFVKTGPRYDRAAEWKNLSYRKRLHRLYKVGDQLPNFTNDKYKHKPAWFTPGDYKIRLTIKLRGGKVKRYDMWNVTWDAIVSNVACRQMAGHRKPSWR